MYWYYVYKWKRYSEPESEWKEVMSVFNSEFHKMVLFAANQPEEWIITFAKDISAESFHALDGLVG